MTIDEIKNVVLQFVPKYSISKIVLFGSRAAGTNTEKSDVDLIIEFFRPVSLITLSMVRNDMEEALGLDVDIIHGPITQDDMITVDNEVTLYAA